MLKCRILSRPSTRICLVSCSLYSPTLSNNLSLVLAISIGTGAHQAGFFDIKAEPTSVNCAHDNVEVRDVKVDLNLKGVK
jgi:hypothetical protein